MGTRTLVWFRSDLRTLDNRALSSASRAGEVVGLFVVCPGQWKEHDWGTMRVDFVLRNVKALSSALAAKGIPLLVRTCEKFDGVAELIEGVMEEHGCDRLEFNKEYELNERRRDEEVEKRVGEKAFVRGHTDAVLVEPGRVRTNDGGYYKVFSPFRKALYEAIESGDEGDALETAPDAKDQEGLGIDPEEVPESLDGFPGEATRPDLWPAGEREAVRRLEAFVEHRIDRYKDDRDTPAINGTSVVSPYLCSGVLSPRQCVNKAMEANSGRLGKGKKGPVAWISEVVWREFYKHILVGFPRVNMHKPFREETSAVKWREDEEQFAAWCEGRTGFPIVDAAMRQLNQTGWMHNRLRMIVAMLLTKNLLIDWRWGERYFMQRLVDGDLGSNNGGWQWSASTGTDAAPYFRIYNPISQSERHDPDGAFIRRFVPELEGVEGKAVHDPSKLPSLLRSKLDYPEPICDLGETRERALETFKSLKDDA